MKLKPETVEEIEKVKTIQGMKDFDIVVNVGIKINWLQPAETIAEEAGRQQAQLNMDLRAYALAREIKKLLFKAQKPLYPLKPGKP